MMRQKINGKQQLTKKESAFVEQVAAGEDQTKAVVKAGYSRKNAKVIGSQLVHKTIVQDAIRERKKEAFRANDLCADMLVGALTEIAFTPIDFIIRENGEIDLGEARRLGLTHLIRKCKVTPTPFGEKIEVEFYSRLEAIKKLVDIKEIRLPSDQEEYSRIRAGFENSLDDLHRRDGKPVADVKKSTMGYYKTNMPEYFEKLIRAGVD